MRTLAAVLALALISPLAAQERSLDPETDRLDWWREARFGLFVHWGPVSLKGTEIGWSRGGERRGRTGRGAIPVEEYDNLYRRFNPTRFDAEQWVAIARRAGMQYLVFTTKHHDGFCMFDTRLNDYKITNSPIGRDLVKELANACHAGGLRLGFYYSQPDWHHEDYRSERHAKYIAYLHGQVRELLSGYGQVDVLWFDGLGGQPADWDAERLLAMARDLQPGILINNRAGLPADFDTPEQRIGKFQIDRPWESCITICRQWAWKPDDTLKSLEECVRTLIRCAGGDGNLLLNVGPMPTGEIEPRQVARLEQIGDWLAKRGEAIHGTRGGPIKPGSWGASTRRGDRLYLHVFKWHGEEIALPDLGVAVRGVRLLGGGALRSERRGDELVLVVPRAHQDPIATVIELRLAGDAMAITPRVLNALGSLTFGRPATASNVYRKIAHYAPTMLLDDDPSTRWATDVQTRAAWVEVDLGAPVRFDRVVIREAVPYDDRVRAFEVQIPDADGWRAILKGAALGSDFSASFPAVEASRVRLAILDSTGGPTLSGFHLFAPGGAR